MLVAKRTQQGTITASRWGEKKLVKRPVPNSILRNRLHTSFHNNSNSRRGLKAHNSTRLRAAISPAILVFCSAVNAFSATGKTSLSSTWM